MGFFVFVFFWQWYKNLFVFLGLYPSPPRLVYQFGCVGPTSTTHMTAPSPGLRSNTRILRISPGKVFFRQTWNSILLRENWVSDISPNIWRHMVSKWTHRLQKEADNPEKSLYCAGWGCYPRISGGGSNLITKVPMMERLPWRMSSWWIFRFFRLSRPTIGWQKGRQKKQKLPKNTKSSRNEKFSNTATENVCLKDAYTVNLKKKSLILIYIITELYAIFYHIKFRLIAPIVPTPFYSNHVMYCLN